MKVCLPTLDDRGLDAVIASHFGSAPLFTLVDTESRSTEVVPNDPAHGEHAGCHSAGGLRDRGVGAILCHGLGRRAFARFAEDGIAVFVIQGLSVRDAVNSLLSGQALLLSAKEACGGGLRHGRQGCAEDPSHHEVET